MNDMLYNFSSYVKYIWFLMYNTFVNVLIKDKIKLIGEII